MLTLHDMIRKVCIRHRDRMRALTSPLATHFGIEYFYYHTVKDDGRLSFITNNPVLQEFYMELDAFKYNP